MVMLLFQVFQKVQMTLFSQKHAFRYVHYLTTQNDPKWPLQAKIYNYLVYLQQELTQKEYFYMFPTFAG